MRRPTLTRWLKRELLSLSGLEHFSLRKLAAMAQNTHARLIAPLFLYCWECNRVSNLLELIYDNDILCEYEQVSQLLKKKNLTKLALAGNANDLLPLHYAKHLNSFKVAYHRQDIDADSKGLRRERCRILQLQKGVSTAKICSELDLDPANVCAFIKQGDLGRITLQDATRMMKYLMAL